MRCNCCNTVLSYVETTMKCANTNHYMDMCRKCYSTIADDVPVIIREDLEDEVGMEIADYIDTLTSSKEED